MYPCVRCVSLPQASAEWCWDERLKGCMCVCVCVCVCSGQKGSVFEVSLLTVRLFTALLYRHNEDESVPGVISDEKGFGVRLPRVTTGLVCVCVSVCGTKDFNSPHCPGCHCWGRLKGGIKGTGREGKTEAKCPLCSVVSCRELLVQGQSGLPGSSLAEKDNTEQRGEGKQSQKHLFRQLGLLYTDEERRLRAAIDQIGLIKH